MSSAIVTVKDLQKTYRSGLIRRRKVMALRGVSFDVTPGEIFGLLGPNGAGKTTLIKILLGIVKRSGGTAEVLGRAAGDRRGRMRIGYLPENHRIPRHLTGNSALDYYGQLSHMSVRDVRSKRGEILEMVGLGKWGTSPVKSYSKGMLQRLGLAQAMLHDPELLILDEPTDGVDPIGRADIRETLFRLKEQGRTILLNSHLLQEIELVCDRAAILQHGRLRHVGLIQDLTEGESNSVVFELAADEPSCRNAIERLGTIDFEPVESGLTKASLVPESQAALDAIVDAARSANISVVSMSRDRLTLEQAFLQLLAQGESESVGSSGERTDVPDRNREEK